MVTEAVNECRECMYCQEGDFCIRRQRKIGDDDFCLHYVRRINRHSLDKLINLMAKSFVNESE